jgi:ATP-dependent helicase/nuclease subunit A
MIFAPGSRAEVPIVGRLAGRRAPILVAGQIDRLSVTPQSVLIVDFKTGEMSDPPPAGYVRQLTLYRAVLANVFPGRVVRAALLWTESLELIEIAPETLDAALQAVISA